MLKDKDKGMDGVNKSDDVLEQAAGGKIKMTPGWKFRVYNDAYLNHIVGTYETLAEAQKVDEEVNGPKKTDIKKINLHV